jgi:hypothetical protein
MRRRFSAVFLSNTPPHIHSNGNNQSILRCYYQNVRSIRSGNKLREFQDTVYANQYDIVAISESWLTSDISDSELLPWDYDIFRCDRRSPTIGSFRFDYEYDYDYEI